MSRPIETPPAPHQSSHLDARRALRGLVLAAWSSFFAWLWFSGEMSRYLGPRTYWVVPFGAVMLGAAAAMHMLTLRSPRRKARPSALEVLGAAVLVVPLLAVATVPSADLGALAASRKTTGGAVIAEGLAGGAEPIENPGFKEIAYAEESQEYADAIGLTEGMEVNLTGFVDDSDEAPEGTLILTRFYVSCCAADAIPFSVAVDPNGQSSAEVESDSWMEAEGALERREDRFVLVATSLEPVSEPKSPYLY